MIKEVNLPITGVELSLVYLKDHLYEEGARTLFHEESERLLRRAMGYLGHSDVDVVHIVPSGRIAPGFTGYIRAMSPGLGIEVGPDPVGTNVGVRIAARSPSMRSLGLFPEEVGLEALYDPAAMASILEAKGITPAGPSSDGDEA